MPHASTSTTAVLIAVARLELTPSMPILARIDVSAANTAESNAKVTHINAPPFLPDFFSKAYHLFAAVKRRSPYFIYILRVEKDPCIFLELHESAVLKALAYLLHEGIIEPEIVHDAKAHGKHFAGLEQMSDISSRMSAASRAGALGVYRAQVALILCVIEIDYAAHGEKMSVTCVAAGHDAVKKVDSARNTLEDISGSADSHEIARLIGGHIRLNCRNYAVHILLRLSDGKTAYRVAVKIELGYTLHMLYTQVIKGAALIYAEEQLIFIYRIGQRIEAIHLRLAALKPTRRACAGLLGILIFRGIFNALVKGHGR